MYPRILLTRRKVAQGEIQPETYFVLHTVTRIQTFALYNKFFDTILLINLDFSLLYRKSEHIEDISDTKLTRWSNCDFETAENHRQNGDAIPIPAVGEQSYTLQLRYHSSATSHSLARAVISD